MTYELGVPSGLRTWYMDTTHGDLMNDRESFPAILDLLQNGVTDRLSTTPPYETRGVSKDTVLVLPESDEVVFPAADDVIRAALGAKISEVEPDEMHTLRLSVMHTDTNTR